MDINKIQTGNKKSNKFLFIILGVIALIAVLIAFVFLGGDSEKEKIVNGELDLKNVSEIIRVSEKNHAIVELYNFKKGEVINSVDLTEYLKEDSSKVVDEQGQKPLYVMDNELTKVYAYMSGTIIEINKKDGKLTSDVLIEDKKLAEVNYLNLNGSKLLLTSSLTNEVHRYNTETKQMLDTVTLMTSPTFATEIDDTIYYLSDAVLYKYNLTDKKVIGSIDLIDVPKEIQTINNDIYAISPFGSGLDNGLLLRVNKKEFNIDSLIELGKGQNKLLTKSATSSMLYISQNSQEKSASLVKVAATSVMSVNDEVSRDSYLEKGVDYLGLLIEENDKGLKIFQLNSENENFELKLDESYFYAPIL